MSGPEEDESWDDAEEFDDDLDADEFESDLGEPFQFEDLSF